MERTTKPGSNLSAQIKEHSKKKPQEKEELDGNFSTVISTGSTLLDLAISGSRIRGGGLCGGILVEAFGPNGSGKTVICCEVAGSIQRKGGSVLFHDPESRLNKQFAQIFDLDTEEIKYKTPNTVTEVFKEVRAGEYDTKKVNGIVTDSLAALSTDMEMDNDDGDKMGMRRAKEFSEQLRKTARFIKDKNLLMMCSNQVRQNSDAGPYSEKYSTPGGMATGFYASLRLQFRNPSKIKRKERFKGKDVERVVGVEVEVYVYKSSIDKPYRSAPVIIIFDYGIDDIRANLQFLKKYTGATTYCLGEEKLGQSIDDAIKTIEVNKWEKDLKERVIDLWEEIESKFESDRVKKRR